MQKKYKMKYDFDKAVNRKGSASIKYDKAKIVFGTDDLLPMWVADMDFETADFIIDSIKNRLQHPVLGYTMRKPSFNQAFGNWAKDRYHWNVKNEWLDFSPGVVSALAICVLSMTNENDKIIIQSPVYHPFYEVVEGNNRQLAINNLVKNGEKYEIDFDALQELVDEKTKMMIISNPHNPVGRVWTKEELNKLADFIIKNDLILISDDIHADFVYSGYRYTPIASLSEEIAQRTITVLSPSKTFNIAGLSTSIAVIPNKELKAKYQHKSAALHLFLGNIFGAVAFESAYNNGVEWLDQLLQYLEKNRDIAVDFINSEIPSINVFNPEGTFLLWLNFQKTGLSHSEIKNKLINEAKLGFNDGREFGKNGEFYFRMNIATQRTNIYEALQRLKNVFA